MYYSRTFATWPKHCMNRFNFSSSQPASTWLPLAASWYLLSALTVPSLLQASATGFLLLAAALVFRRQQFVVGWRQTRPAWILMALAFLLGLVGSGHIEKSLLGLYEATRGVLLFFTLTALLLEFPAETLRVSARYFFSLLAVLLLLVTLFVALQGSTFDLRSNPVLLQHIGNLHELANLAALCLLALACLYWSGEEKQHSLLLPIVFASLVLLATTSRGNWIAVAMGLSFMLLQKNYRRFWILLVTVFLLAYLYIMFWNPVTVETSAGLTSTIGIRRTLYSDTLSLFLHSPWLGHGINTFKYTSGLLDPAGDAYIMPHNIYLGMLYGWGIAGSLIFFSGLFVLLHRCSTGPRDGFLFTFGSVLLVWWFSRGLLDMNFFSFHYIGLTACAAALLCLPCLRKSASVQ